MKTTNAKSKVVTGGTKQRSKVKVGLLVIAGVLLLSAVGYVGFTKYKERDLKAKAAGYATIYNDNGYTIKACRIQTIYGNVVRVVASKPTWTSGFFSVTTYKSSSNLYASGRIASKDTSQWWGGNVAVLEVYGADGWYSASISSNSGNGAFPGVLAIGYTPNC